MAESATPTVTQGPRRERLKMTWLDSLMNFGDIGIAVWAILMYVFLYLPIVVLVIFSFNAQKLNVTWTGFSLHWYNVLFHDINIIAVDHPYTFLAELAGGIALIVVGVIIMRTTENRRLGMVGRVLEVVGIVGVIMLLLFGVKGAFATSMQIAVVSTAFAVVIGTLGSFALVRFEFRTKTTWDGLNYTKIIIAEVVAGVSTLLFFVQLQNFLETYLGFDFWGIFRLGFSTVLIAHVAWSIPFVVVIIRARLRGFDKALEEAGADLGATPIGVFFRVTLPVIAPGIFAATLLSFTLSFDDFVTTFFTAGPSTSTLPLVIWSMVRMGVTPEINAISTFMMAFSMIIVTVLELKAHISEDIA
jgi:spermidine/putrescine transport system permease protein